MIDAHCCFVQTIDLKDKNVYICNGQTIYITLASSESLVIFCPS